MGSHFEDIYRHHAPTYDRMIRREDYEQNLLPALTRLHPLDGADVIEFGAGTGRLTCLLAPLVRRIWAFDLSAHMLGVAAAKLRQAGWSGWLAAVADNRALPVPPACADLTLEGWSFGHLAVWFQETGFAVVGQALDEMLRVLRPGGTAIVIETLGTGCTTPQPPSDVLARFYAYLENMQGFASTWIRTDFRFKSRAEADELATFFFGKTMATHIVAGPEGVILPECTGLWWRSV